MVLPYGARIHKCYLTNLGRKPRLKVGLRRRRLGISELVGSVLAIALTIIAGAAVFGYVNGQAGLTEQQYGSSVGVTIDYLQEQFTVVDMSFTSASQVVVYLYNYGRVAVSPVEVIIYNSTQSVYLTYNATSIVSKAPSGCTTAASTSYEDPLVWDAATSSGMSIAIGSISSLTLTLPACSGATFVSGVTYYVKVTGLYGNIIVNSQVKS